MGIGDITGNAYTHVSMYQADIAVRDILGQGGNDADRAVSRVTFTDPEVGSVGMTEKRARDAGPRPGRRHGPRGLVAAGSPVPRA